MWCTGGFARPWEVYRPPFGDGSRDTERVAQLVFDLSFADVDKLDVIQTG